MMWNGTWAVPYENTKKSPVLADRGSFRSGEKNYFFRDSGAATARSTAMPTMGLLPAPRKPMVMQKKSSFIRGIML